MPRYKYVGPEPVDIPTLDLWGVEPDQVVTAPADGGLADHPHFEAVQKAAAKETGK